MPASFSDVTFLRLARGLVDLRDWADTTKLAVNQGPEMPSTLRRGMALLSRECVRSGVPDIGASLHSFLALAARPPAEWGVPSFASPDFQYLETPLVDADLGMPTQDCIALAAEFGSEIAAWEDIYHETLRGAVKGFRKRSEEAYALIREFVVRNPATRYDDLQNFILNNNLTAAAREINSLYQPVPMQFAPGGEAIRCGHCGSLLSPERDKATYPVGRCRIKQCYLKFPTPLAGERIDDLRPWRLAANAVLAFWVGPGLDEINIYDQLRAKGRKAALYPREDAADVGVDGLNIGIDVKTYASPIALAYKLTKSTGRLDMFRRRIIAVPDDKLVLNSRYIAQLQRHYAGALELEFMTVSQVLGELTS